MSKDLWAIAVATAFFLVFAGWNIVDALIESMTALLRIVNRLADLALYAVAGFAAACLTTDDPDPTLQRLDARVAELEKAMADADWALWRAELLDG